jgi:uncharacterized membrane protein YhdT
MALFLVAIYLCVPVKAHAIEGPEETKMEIILVGGLFVGLVWLIFKFIDREGGINGPGR